MSDSRDRDARSRAADEKRESGAPGGGAGRRDEVGGSGVYPASAGKAPADSEIRSQAAWGKTDGSPSGAEDAGTSELFFYEAEMKAVGEEGGLPVETEKDRPAEETKQSESTDPDELR